MNKKIEWIVECQGDLEAPTRMFESEADARRYFTTIQLTLDQTKYLFSNNRIIEKDNEANAVFFKSRPSLSPAAEAALG